MRLLAATKNDIRYQAKYGFYLLYVVLSALYVAVLLACPAAYRPIVASIIILTDPAMLGTFFIGGIWLLEKGEGLHRFTLIAPLRNIEYIAAKAVSLALISAFAGDAIVLLSFGVLGVGVNYALLTAAILLGSATFTTIGLWVASFAKSVNHYMLLATPLETFIALPPVLAVFGITHPVLNILPGMATWQLIRSALGFADAPHAAWMFLVLLCWLALGLWLALKRVPAAMQADTGESA